MHDLHIMWHMNGPNCAMCIRGACRVQIQQKYIIDIPGSDKWVWLRQEGHPASKLCHIVLSYFVGCLWLPSFLEETTYRLGARGSVGVKIVGNSTGEQNKKLKNHCPRTYRLINPQVWYPLKILHIYLRRLLDSVVALIPSESTRFLMISLKRIDFYPTWCWASHNALIRRTSTCCISANAGLSNFTHCIGT